MAELTEEPTAKPPRPAPVPCTGLHAHAAGKIQHHVAEPRAWPWLPTTNHGHLAKHPYCRHCGKIANVNGERALDTGGIANLIARLDHRLRHDGIKLTETHKRLVMRRLHATGTDDAFGQQRDHQITTIATTIAMFVGLTPDTLESYVRSC